MVKLLHLQKIQDRSRTSGFGIHGTDDYPPHTGLYNCTGTHLAWLQCDVEVAVLKPPVTCFFTCFAYFLTPATVALAVPLYEQIEPLKKNWKAILAGIFAGAMTSALCVLVLSLIFKLSHKQYVTLLPKSITTAIGMGLSEELGGIVTITVAVIIVTGVIGNMFAESICKLFHISDPVAKGVGIGSASHAMGTSKAMEMGEIEGAMSSLSIAVSGLMTVVVSLIFSHIY